jgi:pentatricopeptide repeat protein
VRWSSSDSNHFQDDRSSAAVALGCDSQDEQNEHNNTNDEQLFKEGAVVIETPPGTSLEEHLNSLDKSNAEETSEINHQEEKQSASENLFHSPTSIYKSSDALSSIDMGNLQYLTSLDQMKSLVDEIEAQNYMSAEDIDNTIRPLMISTSNIGTWQGVDLTERLLAKCIEYVTSCPQTTPKDELPFPDAAMYNLVIVAWGKLRSQEGARRTQQILELMSAEFDREYKDVSFARNEHTNIIYSAQPDVMNYASVLQAWARSGSRDAPQRVQGILEEMEYASGLSVLIQTYAEEKKESGGTISGILTKEEQYNKHMAPDRVCYNVVMSTWANNASHPQALNEIHKLITRLSRLSKITGDTERYQPDTRSFNTLIEAYANLAAAGLRRNHQWKGITQNDTLTQKSPGFKAEKVLRYMYSSYVQSKDDGIDLEDSNGDSDGVGVQPNVKSYNCLVKVFSNLGMPERAEAVLMSMLREKIMDENIKMDDFPIMNSVPPDRVTFNSVINAWAKSGRPKAGERAEALLGYMHGPNDGFWLHDGRFDGLFQANSLSYNSVMNAWSQSGSPRGSERAEQILDHMLTLPADSIGRPNGISFSTAIYACIKNNAPERAQRILRKMEALLDDENFDDSGNVPPISQLLDFCYGGVILSWTARSGRPADAHRLPGVTSAAEHAEEVLRQMRHERGIRPLTKIFNAVLGAWAKHVSCPNDYKTGSSNAGLIEVDKVAKVKLLLEAMIRESTLEPNGDDAEISADGVTSSLKMSKRANHDPSLSRPNTASYNFVIEACASQIESPGKRQEAFRTALDTYKRLRQSHDCDPDEDTYSLMFPLICNVLPRGHKERVQICGVLFQQCCTDGLLNSSIWRLSRESIPHNLLNRIIDQLKGSSLDGKIPSSIQKLPHGWRGNSKEFRSKERTRSYS